MTKSLWLAARSRGRIRILREIPLGTLEPQRRQRGHRSSLWRDRRTHPQSDGERVGGLPAGGSLAIVSICTDGGLGAVCLLSN